MKMKKLVKYKEVMEIVGVSRTKLWQMECEGLIPAVRRIGRSVRWDQQEIYLWIKLGCPNAKQFNIFKLSEDLHKVCPDRLVGQDEMMEITGVLRTKLWNMRSSGKLPNPIYLGRSIRWRMSDIESWINTQTFRKSG